MLLKKILNKFWLYIKVSSYLIFCWLKVLVKNPFHVRFFIPWIHYLNKKSNPLEDELPWITFGAKKYLDTLINIDTMVCEFGSGGSTLYLAKKVKKIISIEHDKAWADKIQQKLIRQQLKNCDLYTIEVNKNQLLKNIDNGDNYKEYVAKIDSFPDHYFDLVFIDGRARNECIKHALPKVKNNGYILLDNSERDEYNQGKELLKKYQVKNFYGPGRYNLFFWQTSIWKINQVIN